MAYYTGSANSLTELRQALIDACVAEGWTWNSSEQVLHKGALYANLTISSIGLNLLGRTGLTSGPAPNAVRIGQIYGRAGFPTLEVTWPASYEIFAFTGEIYLVVNYSIDRYQWLAFGQSTVSSLAGSGMWVAGSLGSTLVGFVSGGGDAPINISATGGGDQGGYQQTSCALFWGAAFAGRPQCMNYWVHSGLDGHGWALTSDGSISLPLGVLPLTPLPALLPNSWNSEAVLLPCRCWKVRPSNKVSLVVDLAHARTTRIDNYMPGEVVELGGDRWKMFPWHRRNIAVRNGGRGLDHTGSFGWAIRYEGP